MIRFYLEAAHALAPSAIILFRLRGSSCLRSFCRVTFRSTAESPRTAQPGQAEGDGAAAAGQAHGESVCAWRALDGRTILEGVPISYQWAQDRPSYGHAVCVSLEWGAVQVRLRHDSTLRYGHRGYQSRARETGHRPLRHTFRIRPNRVSMALGTCMRIRSQFGHSAQPDFCLRVATGRCGSHPRP